MYPPLLCQVRSLRWLCCTNVEVIWEDFPLPFFDTSCTANGDHEAAQHNSDTRAQASKHTRASSRHRRPMAKLKTRAKRLMENDSLALLTFCTTYRTATGPNPISIGDHQCQQPCSCRLTNNANTTIGTCHSAFKARSSSY